MKNTKLMLVLLLFLMTGKVMAQEPTVRSLMSKDLTEIPGKEVLMITVEYAPGDTVQIQTENNRRLLKLMQHTKLDVC
jgi:hypothetical protein